MGERFLVVKIDENEYVAWRDKWSSNPGPCFLQSKGMLSDLILDNTTTHNSQAAHEMIDLLDRVKWLTFECSTESFFYGEDK